MDDFFWISGLGGRITPIHHPTIHQLTSPSSSPPLLISTACWLPCSSPSPPFCSWLNPSSSQLTSLKLCATPSPSSSSPFFLGKTVPYTHLHLLLLDLISPHFCFGSRSLPLGIETSVDAFRIENYEFTYSFLFHHVHLHKTIVSIFAFCCFLKILSFIIFFISFTCVRVQSVGTL